MPKLPQVRGSELIRALQKIGYRITRQRGSHAQLRREDQNGFISTFPVPVHAGKTLKTGTLKGILRKADLTVEELINLL